VPISLCCTCISCILQPCVRLVFCGAALEMHANWVSDFEGSFVLWQRGSQWFPLIFLVHWPPALDSLQSLFHNVLPFISFWWIWTKVQNITVMCKLFYDLVPYHRSSQQLYVVKSIKVKYLNNVRFQIWTGWITNTWERSKWENNIYLLQSFKKYFKK